MVNRTAQHRSHLTAERRYTGLLLRGPGVAIVIIMALVAGIPAGADESETNVIAVTPGTSYSRTPPAGWRGTTRQEDVHDKMPRPKSSLTIRAYEGFRILRPYYGDEPAYDVDVTAEIEQCPDGNDRISALNIGGRLYAVDGDCSDEHRRTQVSVSAAGRDVNEQEPAETVIRCNPASWRCLTIDR